MVDSISIHHPIAGMNGTSSEIEPEHYEQGDIDRIEVWYQTMPFEGFRWAMKSHIDKYVYRYELKGGVADLDKAMEFIRRLRAYEVNEDNNYAD